MPLKYKTNDAGLIEVDDKGFPIVIDEEGGKEFGLDAIGSYRRIPELRNEAKGYREKLESAQSTIQILADAGVDLDGLPDYVKKAQSALEHVKNFNEKDWVKVREVETIKRTATEELQNKMKEITTANEQKVSELQSKLDASNSKISKLMIDDRFATSDFVKTKLAMTVKAARRYFRDHFRIEQDENGNDVVVAYKTPNGTEKILSPSNGFEVAGFDEALAILVDRDSDRDSLLIEGRPGGGVKPGDKSGPSRKNPWKAETRNLTEQGKIVRENPTLAKKLAAEAGVTLNI